MQNQPVRQRLLEAVQQHALPRLKSPDLWQIVFTEPPLDFPPGVTVSYHHGKPVSPQDAGPAYSSDLTHNWPELMLQSSRFPMLGFVVEGTIDWRVGINTRMAKNGNKEMRRSNYMTVGMPKGTFFLMPPGVPYSEPDCNYWSRSVEQGSPVKVLWLQFHRFGIQCFMSYTVAGKGTRDSALYIADSRTIFAAETLIEELNRGKNSSRKIVDTLLQFCMQRLERSLQNEVAEVTESVIPTSFSQSSATEIVEQACLYIEAHFDQKVTLDSVATQVYISPSHLARLFQAEKGMSITEYLTRFRMEYVCTLLAKTDLRINHIGKISGYRNHSYFCQAFQRRMGQSPQEYRNAAINKTKA